MTLRKLWVAAVALLGLLGLAAGVQAADAPLATTRVLDRQDVIARHADADSRFIDVDGVQVHYKDQGSGPVLLLVHGTLGDLSDWDGWTAVLSRRMRVVRLDLPSFGLTGPVRSGNYSVDRWLGLVDGFMDQLGVERFAIAGISYGGLVAFRYAATRTERVSALVLANSAGIETGRPPAAAPSASAASAAARASIFRDLVVTAEDIERNVGHMLVDRTRLTPQMVQRKLAFANIQGRGEESVAGRTMYERGDPMRVLAHVRAPSLVLWGGGNKALNPATADLFVGALKNACRAERIVYADAGHLLMVDQPERSAADVLAFLTRVQQDRSCRPPAAAKP